MSLDRIDVVVIGGGVAGLSAAISANRQGLAVLLLERDIQFGKRIKGEVINKSAEVFKGIFGKEGLPESINHIVFKTAKYYTPSTKKYAKRFFPTKNKIGIEYRELIKELERVAISEGVRIKLNSEVLELIERDEMVIGLKYQEFEQVQELFPKLIICATGLHTKLNLPPRLKRPTNVCPAIKIIGEDLNIPDPHELEFFFLNIPGVIWIFPKPRNRAELGVTTWMNHDKHNLRSLLNEAAKIHPILKERLRRGNHIYSKNEFLAFGGPVKQTYIPNLIVVGDAMGHVGAVGGSGIVSSMTIGYHLGHLLGKRLTEKEALSLEDFQEAQRTINKSAIGKYLKKEQSSAKAMREILYNPPKSPDEIDGLWDKFKGFIESRGA
ncbi:MAG: NAD(P)/FAD-dependent oxidoreductase [Candidatus Helarchaeota archaeon]|nr:NAD(P)/FAD-dependent oxidoreductase [Candidatus Helarchaeota archaeon]